MKAVLMSIQPKWCEKIANGAKTIELRKSKPKLETPFKCYIYCTKPSKKYQTICGCMVINTDELYRLPNGEIKHDWSGELMCCNGEYTRDNFLHGKVIGEFVCDRIDEYANGEIALSHNTDETCLTNCELADYIEGSKAYFWHITDLKIYDKPKELGEFYKECKDVKDFPNSCRRKSCDHYYEEWQNCYAECCFNGERPLERPPQSWCYVEELQNG